MKKAKQIASLLLAGTMAVSLAACGGQETVTNNPEDTSSSSSAATSEDATDAAETSVRPTEPSGQLVIGSITQVINEFYDTSFSNSATNYAMYDLIHGGDTVVYTKEGEFAYNDTVLASHEETDNEDGSKTYTMTIKDGLVWSDGSRHHRQGLRLRSAVLSAATRWAAWTATPATPTPSWSATTSGTTAPPTPSPACDLIDDMTFSVTIKAEELPYHWDISYAGRPSPPDGCHRPGLRRGGHRERRSDHRRLHHRAAAGDHQQHRHRLPLQPAGHLRPLPVRRLRRGLPRRRP